MPVAVPDYRFRAAVAPSAFLLCALVAIASDISLALSAEIKPPPQWGRLQLAPGEPCVSLAGTYEYLGEAVGISAGPEVPRFDSVVLMRGPSRGSPTSVLLDHDVASGRLRAEVRGPDLTPATSPSLVRDLQCLSGWSVFRGTAAGSAEGATTSMQTENRLARSDDGALIVHRSYEATSRVLFSTRHYQGSAWYRFRLIR